VHDGVEYACQHVEVVFELCGSGSAGSPLFNLESGRDIRGHESFLLEKRYPRMREKRNL